MERSTVLMINLMNLIQKYDDVILNYRVDQGENEKEVNKELMERMKLIDHLIIDLVIEAKKEEYKMIAKRTE
ncbi:hypothetical protein [Bacillus pumilus]|uniref:hypothetical protein n=1 Tax=Bacillus pumilus TaxID=1408 RepID=UPI0007EED680|nr:hypothetical protein [Bacillus pumilus]OBS85774.1 hypothetical protein BAY68_19335 [Bacillus pumilus]